MAALGPVFLEMGLSGKGMQDVVDPLIVDSPLLGMRSSGHVTCQVAQEKKISDWKHTNPLPLFCALSMENPSDNDRS